MPHPDTLPFYQAYVVNVNDFLLAESEIRRAINRAIKSGKPLTVSVQTKIYALLYSTFSEANFMKMILTPHGLDQGLIDEILSQDTIKEKWLKCLEVAFISFSRHSKGSEIPNKLQELKRIVDRYVVDPSILRNKIAHGQLTVALNSKTTGLNLTISDQLQELNFVTIYRWFSVNRRLVQIVEDLIESPDKAHYNYYYSRYQELESFIERTEGWTIETKMRTTSMKKEIKR